MTEPQRPHGYSAHQHARPAPVDRGRENAGHLVAGPATLDDLLQPVVVDEVSDAVCEHEREIRVEQARPWQTREGERGLAELCAKHPDRFAGYVGALPMNAPEAAAKEAERILIHGNANGLQLHTNVDGACLDEPRFFPILRTPNVPDFPAETKSKYEIWAILGWPYETSCTMARLIFSGVTTRLPDLKILIHHLGAMIPFFDARLDTGWATLGSRTSDEDYGGVLKMLGKPLMDCFRDFYADTALCGGRIGTVCGLEFFGADHVLFASDAPFGAQGGASYIRETMKVIAGLEIAQADKEKICYRNAQALFKLS
ncbi:MAG: amidohydrolase [Alphaproteobacteria bacterium]|nr:MAG: amidohydrolase [Alphaproteobacteria bacterium]